MRVESGHGVGNMDATSGGGGMRSKISALESTLVTHESTINGHSERVGALEESTVRMAAYIDEKMEQLKGECATTIAQFKDDADKKFLLQTAENKRLNVQMAKQKAENQKLIDRIHALEARCSRLELEVGAE